MRKFVEQDLPFAEERWVSSWEEHPASRSVSQDAAKDSRGQAALPSTLPDFCERYSLSGLSGRMSQVRFRAGLTDSSTSTFLSERLQNAGMVSHGEFLTLNMSEASHSPSQSRSGDAVCSLSDVLETGGGAGKVLLEGEGVCGDITPRRITMQGASGYTERSPGVSVRTAHTKVNGCGIGVGTAHTLGAGDVDAVLDASAFNFEPFSGECKGVSPCPTTWWDGSQVAATIGCTTDGGRMPGKVRLQCVIGFDQNPNDARCTEAKGSIGTLTARMGTGGNNTPLVLHNGTTPAISRPMVRRLTPVEAERLMGFPDNWTRIPWRGKPAEKCPDAPRYKACGNSFCVNCVEWIGERIEKVERTLQEEGR